MLDLNHSAPSCYNFEAESLSSGFFSNYRFSNNSEIRIKKYQNLFVILKGVQIVSKGVIRVIRLQVV